MRKKYIYLFTMSMILIVIFSTLYISNRNQDFKTISAAKKQLQFTIKQPTYFPNKVIKSQAQVIELGGFQEVVIDYISDTPDKNFKLRVTNENLMPAKFSERWNLSSGITAIHISGMLYWEQDGLFYTLIGVPYQEELKVANSLS